MLTRLIAHIVVLFSVTIISSNAFGQGCQYAPCSPNPTPCAHCIGTWTDDTNARWSVTSPGNPTAPGTQSVSGSVSVPMPYGCPTVTYNVSGTLTQTAGLGETAINWTASNPNPSAPCHSEGYVITPASTLTYTGNIVNNGCDTASGTWSSSTGTRGSFSMTKPSDVATNENPSSIIAWWASDPTILMFEGNIVPNYGYSLAGRQVFEIPNGSPSDNCFHASDAAYGYSSYHLDGSGWFVGYYYFGSNYYYDYVGMSSGLITYYRNQNRTPCLAQAPQSMNIYTNGEAGHVAYYQTTLYVNLPDHSWVGVARGTQVGWRTY
jgi:hypothetical protein